MNGNPLRFEDLESDRKTRINKPNVGLEKETK